MNSPPRYWQSVNPLALLLLPLALAFRGVTLLRRLAYQLGVLPSRGFDVPVVVVGNLTVGGTGKTPLVIWLAGHLAGLGYRPGIVSRGYGGKASRWPQQVRADSDAGMVGDEAIVLAMRTGCPVCVGPDRPRAVESLLAHTDCDIVLSDDGLQHYAMRRDLEIVVIDGERRFGNGFPLPAGPMRESPRRLRSVDLVVCNGGQPADGEHGMRLRQPVVLPLGEGSAEPLKAWAGRAVHALAGIGHPARFFDSLTAAGLQVDARPFPDHHAFSARDLAFDDGKPVLMTDKDAVKCRRLISVAERARYAVVRVDAQPDAGFIHRLNVLLQELDNGSKTS